MHNSHQLKNIVDGNEAPMIQPITGPEPNIQREDILNRSYRLNMESVAEVEKILTPKEREFMQNLFEKKAELIQLATAYEAGPSNEDYFEGLVVGLMTREELLQLYEKIPQLHNKLWLLEDGRVLLYSLPSYAHESGGAAFASMIYNQLSHFNIYSLKKFYTLSSPTIFIGEAGLKEPDFAFVPQQRRSAGGADTHANPYPTLVLETAYQNESLKFLKKELEAWMHGTHVIMAVGIKIFRQNKGGNRKMTCLIYERNKLPQEISFGSDRPLSLDPISFKIPIKSVLFDGVDCEKIKELPQESTVSIDLSEIRDFALSLLR